MIDLDFTRPVIASISGGKDSAALSLWLHEQGIEHERVFMDTGWEHPATYDYLKGELQDKIGTIKWLHNDLLMHDLILKKKMFPSRLIRFCTQELKLKPITKYFNTFPEPPINAVGIRAAESQARAKMSEIEECKSPECTIWRPLLKWRFEDVAEIHRRHNLKPNPLYFMGASRVGCWPCIHVKKADIRLVAELTPERIDEIEQLERRVESEAMERYKKRGQKFKPENKPTFFHSSAKKRTPVPIREVVKWSQTAYGGKQYLLFSDQPEGCVRWGMCEPTK